MAELGARQPRPPAARVAARPGQERAAAYLLLTLRGTPTLYYGDEIGMRDVEIAPERRVDPWALRQPRPGPHADAVGRRRLVHRRGEPWLPFAPDHATVNVAAQRDDPDSLLSLYRGLLALRRTEPDLVDGAYRTLAADGDVLRFARGDSIEVRIDFAAGDGAILKDGARSALGPHESLSRQKLVTLRFACRVRRAVPAAPGPAVPVFQTARPRWG